MRTTNKCYPAIAMLAGLAVLVGCADSSTAPAHTAGIHTATAANSTTPAITATDLGANSRADAVNARGMVVGVGPNGHATLWWHGGTTDLGTLGASSSEAYAINAGSTVVGVSGTASGQQHAFLWRNGTMRDLGTLGGSYSIARAVDPAGRVVGSSTTAAGGRHAFLWDNGTMEDLGTLGGANSDAYDIGPSGEVVGVSDVTIPVHDTHAFLWQRGMMTDIATTGGTQSQARAMNAAGLIAGMDFDPRFTGAYRLIFWHGTSASYSGFENDHLVVHGLAIDGSVVGGILALPYESDAPFLWQGGTLTVLPLPDAGIVGPRGQALGIDPTGRFVAGFVRSVDITYGEHAVLWTVTTSHAP